jgi:signal peptidase II
MPTLSPHPSSTRTRTRSAEYGAPGNFLTRDAGFGIMNANARRLVLFVTVTVIALGLDQGSKAWAHTLPPGVPQPVIDGYWDWQLVYNDGIAFSLLRGQKVVLALIAVLAVGAIGYAARATKPEQRLRRVAYGLIAGGALGNLIDRVRDGAVTDFVRWHIRDHMWPVFNVADALLLAGVALVLSAGIFERRHARDLTVQT